MSAYDELQNFAGKVCELRPRLLRNKNIEPSDMRFRAIILVKYLIRSSSMFRHATRVARISSKNLVYSTESVGAPSNNVKGTRLRKIRIR